MARSKTSLHFSNLTLHFSLYQCLTPLLASLQLSPPLQPPLLCDLLPSLLLVVIIHSRYSFGGRIKQCYVMSLYFKRLVIWDDVGESEATRDRLLLELEQECLDLYTRKVDQVNRCRAQIRQAIAYSDRELPIHFRQVIGQIQKLSTEIYGSEGSEIYKADVNENELSLRKLEELQTQLHPYKMRRCF